MPAISRASAADLGIRLIEVPTGATGIWQRLDRGVYGMVKRKTTTLIDESDAIIDGHECEALKKEGRASLPPLCSRAPLSRINRTFIFTGK
jgi:hypothetical protein